MAETVESGKLLNALSNFIDSLFKKWSLEDKQAAEAAMKKAEESNYIFSEDDNTKALGQISEITLSNSHKAMQKFLFAKPVFLRSGQINLEDSSLYPISQYIKFDTGKEISFDKSQSPKNIEELKDNFILSVWEAYPDLAEEFNVNKAQESEMSEAFENFGADEQNASETAEASRKIQIKLTKINSSSEIVHDGIFANYAPIEVYQDLEDVLEDQEFVDSLPEGTSCFELTPSDDFINICEIDSIQPMDSVTPIIRMQIITYLRLLAYCKDVTLLDSNPYARMQQIQWHLEFLLESKLTANINLLDIISSIDCPAEVPVVGDISDIMEEYAVCLDLYYPNFPHEIQALIDEWLRAIRYPGF